MFFVVVFIYSIAISSQNSSAALSSPAGHNRVHCVPRCGLEYWSGIYGVLQVQSGMINRDIDCKGKSRRTWYLQTFSTVQGGLEKKCCMSIYKHTIVWREDNSEILPTMSSIAAFEKLPR